MRLSIQMPRRQTATMRHSDYTARRVLVQDSSKARNGSGAAAAAARRRALPTVDGSQEVRIADDRLPVNELAVLVGHSLDTCSIHGQARDTDRGAELGLRHGAAAKLLVWSVARGETEVSEQARQNSSRLQLEGQGRPELPQHALVCQTCHCIERKGNTVAYAPGQSPSCAP